MEILLQYECANGFAACSVIDWIEEADPQVAAWKALAEWCSDNDNGGVNRARIVEVDDSWIDGVYADNPAAITDLANEYRMTTYNTA